MVERGELIDGRFLLDEPLGSGTFAAVWRARDRENADHTVAIKLLFEHHAADDKKLQRFVQEARILERLDHPNVAQPIAWSASPELSYLAMELIDGETLDEKLKDHAENNSPIPKEGITWICDQLCAAMAYAHAQTIVHRDLKPRNVLISRRGQRPFLKVLDFGIAKILLGGEVDPTTVGKVLGSVLYISPEQVLAQPIDHRADIFSLGTILFEVITLHRAWARTENNKPLPFHASTETGGGLNSHIGVLRRIARDERPRASELRPDISDVVDQVLAKAMAIKAEDRFATVDELSKALRLSLLDPMNETTEPSPGPARELQLGEMSQRPPPADPAEPKPARPRSLPSFKAKKTPVPVRIPANGVGLEDTTMPHSPPAQAAPVEAPPELQQPQQLQPRGVQPIMIFGAAFFIAAIAIVVLAYLILAH